MPSANVNGLTIEYEMLGDPINPVILLIMGLGMQLTSWPDAFCQQLVDGGFRVIRFDNRDCGLSSKIQPLRRANVKLAIFAALLRLPVRSPYVLDDMAGDAVGLLDALGIDCAHVVGASMGGMIAQLLAVGHPNRVISLTSIMSSSGNRRAHRGQRDGIKALLGKPADPNDPESVIAHMMKVHSVIGSPGFPVPRDELRQRIERNVTRSYYPAGTARQLLAILASGDRRRLLVKIVAPTLVIHGAEDKLVPVAAGRDTAKHIRGAKLKIIAGMGHDLAPGLQPILAAEIVAHCRANGAMRHA